MSVTTLRTQPTNTQKFGALMGSLYDAVGVENGVRTPAGIGTLRRAFSTSCLVSQMRERETKQDGSGKSYRPMRECRPEEVEVL